MVFEMVVDQICGCLEAGYDDHVCLIKSLSGVGRDRIVILIRYGSCSKLY